MKGEKIAHELYVFAKFGLFEKAWLTLMSLQKFFSFDLDSTTYLRTVQFNTVLLQKNYTLETKNTLNKKHM